MRDVHGDFPCFVHTAAGYGFVVVDSSLDMLLQDTAILAPGEKVSFGEFDLFHFADGTIRVEGPDNLRVANSKYADARYWLELAPNGQYSSHRFDPANPPAPITDPAAHFAPFVEPGMTYCNYFRAKSGTYVVSASDPDGCHPAPSLIHRFVYEDHEETATYVGRPDTWYCLNGEHGIVCNHGTRDHVAGKFVPDEQ